MMPIVFLEPGLDFSIQKFLALIRLHTEGSSWGGPSAYRVQPSDHVGGTLRFDGDGPGILGQDIDDRQQIFVALVPPTEFLHVH